MESSHIRLFVIGVLLTAAVFGGPVSAQYLPCSAACTGECCRAQIWICTIPLCQQTCQQFGAGGCMLGDCDSYDGGTQFCCNGAATCIFICTNGTRHDIVHWCRPDPGPNCNV